MPQVAAVDKKEVASEQIDLTPGGDAGSKFKKLINRIPGKGPGEAPVAMDLKSSVYEENRMLRKALEDSGKKTTALEEKQKLQAVAEKIYEIVAELQEKGLVASGKEDGVIDMLTQKFANLEALESLKGFVGTFPKYAAAEGVTPAVEKTEEENIGKVVPQVFEAVETNKDVVSELSRIWNL